MSFGGPSNVPGKGTLQLNYGLSHFFGEAFYLVYAYSLALQTHLTRLATTKQRLPGGHILSSQFVSRSAGVSSIHSENISWFEYCDW